MLCVYRRQNDRLVLTGMQVTAHLLATEAEGAVWIDLVNPSREEDQFVERLVGVFRRRKRRRRSKSQRAFTKRMVGAIGVSGSATEQEDEQCAKAGVEALDRSS